MALAEAGVAKHVDYGKELLPGGRGRGVGGREGRRERSMWVEEGT